MSKKLWTKVPPSTFDAHLGLFEEVRHTHKDDTLIYYGTLEGQEQCLGRIDESGCYIVVGKAQEA